MLNYVFIFLGEFGYELLNWQGAIRKFHQENPDINIICVGRRGTDILYPYATYIPLSHIPCYQNSISSVYSAQVGEACKNNIKNYIKEFLNTDKVKFIFSNNKGVSIDKVKFCEGGIYDTLPIHKNIYTQLHIKESEKPYYSNKFTLPPKFILIQRAIRNDTTFKGKIIRLYRNKDTNNEEKIINLLKDTYPLIFLDSVGVPPNGK